MNLKVRNTIGLAVLLLIIVAAGGIYSFVVQRNQMKTRKQKVESLQKERYDTKGLKERLAIVKQKAEVLDSILAARKYNIPQIVPQTKFYNFVNKASFGYSTDTQINIQYIESRTDKNYNYYIYKLTGSGEFNDLYNLIYAIEQSKELKKIRAGKITSYISSDENGIPHYLVNFDFDVLIYYANDDRFITKNLVENNLVPGELYNIFYPLIRTEIPPNIDNLMEVEGAKLLALLPEGAYMADSKGNTFILWEGDKVYLGYLTKIDYDNSRVSFILNKGGIIEKINLQLEKEKKK
jgi:hypothetical protein